MLVYSSPFHRNPMVTFNPRHNTPRHFSFTRRSLPRPFSLSVQDASFIGQPLSWTAVLRPRRPKPIKTICRVRREPIDDLSDLVRSFGRSLQNFVKTAYVAVWKNGWARLAVMFAFVVGAMTVLMNTWIVSHINTRILPDTTTYLTQVMERDVSLGKVKWMLPTGLLGWTSVASMGPVCIGPGTIEKSEIRVSEIQLGLDWIRSMMRNEIVLNVHCDEAEAKVIQADNYSWFGRPVDTAPPSTDFVPGLHKTVEPEPDVDVGSFMGMTMEEEWVRNFKLLAQKLSRKRRENERRMSQYTCSTSDQKSNIVKRRVVASLSTDIKGEDKETPSVPSFSAMSTSSSPLRPPARQNRSRPFSNGHSKRLKLAKTVRETSHGIQTEFTIRPRPESEMTKTRRSVESQRRRKEQDGKHHKKSEIDHQRDTQANQTASPDQPSPSEARQETDRPSQEQDRPSTESSAVTSSESPELPSVEDPTSKNRPVEDVSMEEVRSWATAAWKQLTKNLKFPNVALRRLSFDRSTILTYTTKEDIPREFINTRATIHLGCGYHTLDIDVQAEAHKRHPDSIKWTKNLPEAPIHLRFVTPGAETQFDRLFPTDITSSSHLATAEDDAVHGQLITDDPSKSNAIPFSSISAGGSNIVGIDQDGLHDVRRSPPKIFPPPSTDPRSVVPNSRIRTYGRPKGGSVRVTATGKDLFLDDRVADLRVTIAARQLHAPLLERLLEIPIDVQDGRVTGSVTVTSNTPKTWQMPRIDGHIQLKDVDMHFWDAPDHVSKATGDLMLENNRMYFHEASGHFGALPLVLSGDMDIDPEYGEYRLTAVLDPVELNVARATFGIRPTPNPIAGAVQGLVHCTGPLRVPVFSGVVNCIQPTEGMMQAMEESAAKQALKSHQGAVGAFDKIPFESGKLLFTHDMNTDVFTVHDFAARPVGGGKIQGTGQIWVAPKGEHDPHALHLRCDGHRVSSIECIRRYFPDNIEVPKVLDCGATDFRLIIKGSHADPQTKITFEASGVELTGEASLSRTAWKATAKAPAFDISGTLHTQLPDFERTKRVYTQKEMTKLCRPIFEGVDSYITLRGCDMMPLFSNGLTVGRSKSRRAVRLKVSGTTHINAHHLPSEDGEQPRHFQGDVTLQGIRLNQVNLAKQLMGKLEVSPSGVSVNAKGQRDDEMLDFSISLPESGEWLSQGSVSETEPMGDSTETEDVAPLIKGARFDLKQGRLDVSSQVDSETSRVQMQIRGLTLDELELASLRGDLQDVSLDLNFLKREGRGEVHMTMPRFSGLLGEALSGGFRWESDVVRLEKMILQQKASRYEVQGEYALPATMTQQDAPPSPPSEPSGDGGPNWLPNEVLAATSRPSIGRWRLQINVPKADVQEILPAMRLLKQATSVRETDYEKAKEKFLKGLSEGGHTSPSLSEVVKAVSLKTETEKIGDPAEDPSSSAALPGIQSLRGKWNGTLQAFGGGSGASTLNFNLKGHSWKWGEYEVDEAVTVGSYHSAEGARLEEISVRTGDARFSLRGDLFGPKQDASFILNDFPAGLLSPVYKSIPALQNAIPTMTDHQGIQRLMDGWERTKTTLGWSDVKEDTPMEKLIKGSPVNGLLFVRGTIGGSVEAPQGILSLDLYDGTIGNTQLSTAGAQFALSADKTIEFKLESTPLASKGLLLLKGTVPLPSSGHREDMDVRLRIKDGGMALVAALVPEFKWETGSADIDLKANGRPTDPFLDGTAKISRAGLFVPNLRYPLKHTYASIKIVDGKLVVDHFESKSGNNGHIKAKGALPIFKDVQEEDALGVTVSRLELKVNSAYNGRLDSRLTIRRSLKEPVVSGEIELSRGVALLNFGAFPNASASSEGSMTRPTTLRFQDIQMPRAQSMATATPVIQIPKKVPMEGVRLEGLKLKLGNELRFQVPFMVNLLLSGGIEVSGAPNDLKPVGEINIDGGMVNLFATQLTIDREDSPGKIRFSADQGFDPELDITLTSPAEGFKAICKGRASTWQENVILRFRGVDATDEENLSQAAKVFQTKLADALVAENGQLALVNLAASTMATMSPRLDTWGQIGDARWRIVSAPNIPYLLTSSDLDFQDIVTSLLSGTEIEIQYGPTQAVIAHKLRGSTFGMHYNVAFNLTDNLKLSAGLANAPSPTTSVLLQYRSEGRTKMK